MRWRWSSNALQAQESAHLEPFKLKKTSFGIQVWTWVRLKSKMLHQFTGGPAAFPFPENPGNSKLILTHQDRSAASRTTVDGNALRFTKIQVQFILDSLEPSDKSAVGTVGIKTEDGKRLIFPDPQGHRFVSGQSEIIADTVFREIAPHVQSIHPWLR